MSIHARRVWMSLVGVLLCGVFVGLFRYSALGVDPFQCFVSGAHALIPLPYGTVYILLSALLLAFSLIFDRHYIGLATFLNLFLLGYVVEYTEAALRALQPQPSLTLRLVLMPVALLGSCLAGSLYMTADLGVSVYDAIALIISETWHKMHFRVCRILTDVTCLLAGSAMFLLGGNSLRALTAFVGIGTVLTAFCMGPIVAWLNDHLSKPLLYGRESGEVC